MPLEPETYCLKHLGRFWVMGSSNKPSPARSTLTPLEPKTYYLKHLERFWVMGSTNKPSPARDTLTR